VDETYVGGATQGEGSGRHHKTLVGGIVEVRPRKKAPGPDPNLPSGQRPQHRGGHGRGVIYPKERTFKSYSIPLDPLNVTVASLAIIISFVF